MARARSSGSDIAAYAGGPATALEDDPVGRRTRPRRSSAGPRGPCRRPRPSAPSRPSPDAARGCARAGPSAPPSPLRAEQHRGVDRSARRRSRAARGPSSAAPPSRRRARPRRAPGARSTTISRTSAPVEHPARRPPGARDVGDAGVLLGRRRAAERAHARADAALARFAAGTRATSRAARRLAARPPRCAPASSGVDLGDRQRPLDPLEAPVAARSRRAPGRTRVRQRSSTRGGVRKHVPELTSVVPPMPRPSGSAIGGLPSVSV